METLFDVGDKILVILKGKVKRIDLTENGDVYEIKIDDGRGRDTYVYLDPEALETANKICE